MIPYSKYQVERAKNGKGLVHIRCCYNNKYWVRWSKNHWWIVAGADEPDEDQSSWSCTLFEPVYVDGDAQTLRLCHVQLEHYACLWRLPPPYGSCLFAGSASPDKDLCDVCTIIDWESLLILPKLSPSRAIMATTSEPGRSRDTHIWSLHQVTLETRLWGTRSSPLTMEASA